MHVDARQLLDQATLEADVAIVGAGPAGITVAQELMGRGLTILLIECGTFDRPEPYAEDVARWVERGIRDTEKHQCNRRVGGSTWYWGSHARPLDPIDFEKRDWVPHSGWPVSYAQMAPFFDRTLDLLELRAMAGEHLAWDAREVPDMGTTDWPEVCFPLNRFGAIEFSQRAAAMRLLPGVTFLTSATVSDIRLRADLSAVDHLVCSTPSGSKVRVHAARVVLASGGVENPSILLRANAQIREGIGNERGLVGRFLQAHPTVECPFRFLSDFSIPTALQIDWKRALIGNISARREALRGYAFAKLALAEKTQREHRLLNSAAALAGFHNADATKVWDDLAKFLTDYGAGLDNDGAEKALRQFGVRMPHLLRALHNMRTRQSQVDYFFNMQIACEQAPNPESRVTLTDDVDALGNRRPAIDWRLTDLDRRSAKRTAEVLGLAFEVRGLAEDDLRDPILDPAWPGRMHGGFHYIGTTRMGHDASTGVVDANAKVFGVDNLYITGCSIFPTSGHAPPTFTLVALAARLASHLRGDKADRLLEPRVGALSANTR